MKNSCDCIKDSGNARSRNYRDSARIQDISMLKGTNSVTRDMNEVFSEKNWERYKQKSLLTFASIISN